MRVPPVNFASTLTFWKGQAGQQINTSKIYTIVIGLFFIFTILAAGRCLRKKL